MKILLHLLFVAIILSSCQPASPIPYEQTDILSEARIDTLAIGSKSMNKSIPAIVILPDGYDSGLREYPVVYLLHGATGNYTDWTIEVPALSTYASEQQLIIVCPDGGYTSWYWDSPIDPTVKYETHITKEVIPYVDSMYRTRPEASQRAITGLSMGGHGALYLAARHPDLFGAAGSMSGGVDFRPFPEKWDIKERLGKFESFPERWEANAVVSYDTVFAKNQQALIIDCGVADFFYEVNEDLHERLMKLNVDHDYIIRPGEHNWDYWRNGVEYQLLFFEKYFNQGARN